MSESLVEVIENDPAAALEIYTTPRGLDPYLDQVEKEIEGFVPDVSTKEGRKEIARIAAKVAKSKVYLDNVGKALVSKLKEQPKLVDAERKRIRDRLDELRDKVREPLTIWEHDEAERISSIQDKMSELRKLRVLIGGETSEIIQARIEQASSTVIDDSFCEFKGEAAITKDSALTLLNEQHAKILQSEEDVAELIKFRRVEEEEETRKQKEKAVEEEKRKANQKGKDLKKARLEEKLKAAEKVRRAKENEETAKRQLKEAKEKSERDQKQADERLKAKLKEERDKHQAQLVKQKEDQLKEAQEKEVKESERKKSAQLIANAKAHAMNDLRSKILLDEAQSYAVVEAIFKGEIRSLTSKY